MNRTGNHTRSFPIVRILCLVMIAVMLAQPVMAALSFTTRCDGGCCCCPTADQDADLKIRAIRATVQGCCGTDDGAAACRMTPMQQPDRLPALIRVASPLPVDTAQSLPDSLDGLSDSNSTRHPMFRADTGPRSVSTPLYLKTCRLIC